MKPIDAEQPTTRDSVNGHEPVLQRPQAKRPLFDVGNDDNDDDDQTATTNPTPTLKSECLLSQIGEPPQKSRRITVSPRVLSMKPADDREGNKDRKSSSDKWITNEIARDFVSNKPPGAESARAPSNYSGKENAGQKTESSRRSSNDSDSCRNTGVPYRPRSKSPYTSAEKSPTEENNAVLDNQQEVSEKSPKFKYQEVVRKKSERAALNGYECPDCAAFYDNVVGQGEGANVFNRREFLACSRHRARDTPPQTPNDFWELSFADEQRKKMEEG